MGNIIVIAVKYRVEMVFLINIHTSLYECKPLLRNEFEKVGTFSEYKTAKWQVLIPQWPVSTL